MGGVPKMGEVPLKEGKIDGPIRYSGKIPGASFTKSDEIFIVLVTL